MTGTLALGWYGTTTLVPRLTPESCRFTVGEDSISYSPEQAEHAATIAAVGVREGMSTHDVTIALATALQESKLRNLDHGDRDSLGLFQQRPSQGWGTPEQLQDPVYAAYQFYVMLALVEDRDDRPLTEVAQEVQRSGFPDAYARHEERSALLSAALTAAQPGAVTCRLDPPAPEDVPVSREEVAEELTRQVDVTPEVTGEGLVAVLEDENLAWTVGGWAVAHARRTGVQSVSVGDHTWTRGKGPDATRWSTDTPTGAAPTEVRIHLP